MNDPSIPPKVDPQAELELVVDEFTDRLNRGDAPNVDEWAKAHPLIANLLREVLTPLVALQGSNTAEDASQNQATPVPAIGQQLGEYKIVREVGRGGMAIVYEATHVQLRRRVALKVLGGHLRDDVFVQRFEREARAAANLHHTHIVPVYETGQADGMRYIAMQYIAGRSLDQAVRTLQLSNQTDSQIPLDAATTVQAQAQEDTSVAGPGLAPVAAGLRTDEHTRLDSILSDSDSNYFLAAARIGMQAADALQHAHRQGVLHRDIKPSNLLLDEQNDVWVSDFGLAKLEDDNLTQTGDIVGTLRYMAAERFAGQCDARSDVYGLGVTLYELVTLRPAFDQVDRLQLMRQVTVENPPRARQVDPRVPRDLDTIITKAMSREPAHRYQTAHELAEDLRRFLADTPILASRTTVRDRVGRWCRRNPVPATLATLLLASLVTGAGLFAWQFSATLRANEELLQTNQELVLANQRERVANRELADANHAEQAARKEAEAQVVVNAAVTEFMVKSFRRPDPAMDGRSVTLASRLDSAFEKLKQDSGLTPIIRGVLLETIGISYRDLGLAKQSIEALQMSDEHFAEELASDSQRRIGVQSQLGFALVGAGMFDRAIEVLEPALKNALAEFGEYSDEANLAINHLSVALRAAGQAERGLQLIQPVYEYQRKHAGRVTEPTLQTVNNLALVFQSTGKLDQAIELFEEAAEGHTRLFGASDPRTLIVKSNLAVAYLNKRQPARALPLIVETLQHRREILGEDHAETLGAENNLAGVYMMSGQVDKAVETLAELLPRMQNKLGPTHPNTLSIQYNLAGGYLMLKQPEQALPLFEQSWEQMKTTLGPKHPSTQKCYRNMGKANQRLGNHEQAKQIFGVLLEVERQRDPPRPTAIAGLLDSIGELLVQQDAYVEAEPLLREALVIWEEHKSGQWQVEITRGLIGEALSGQGLFDQADAYLVESHQRLLELTDTLPSQRRDEILTASRERLNAFQRLSKGSD